ncbi:MAG: argininosuccinate synthase [Vicinamibacterales bacterium]
MDRLILPVLTVAAAPVVAELAAQPGIEVVAVAVDLGHDDGLDALRDAALAAGALRCHVVDRRDALAEGVLWPALRAGALVAPGAPIHTALSMPVVAEAIAEVARFEHASGAAVWVETLPDRQRLRALLGAVMPGAGLVAATRPPAPAEVRNLWASVAPAGGDEPARPPRRRGRITVAVGFERGMPVRLNGVPMTPVELVDSLQTLAGDHGVAPWEVRDPDTGQVWTVRAPAARVLAHATAVITARSVDPPTAGLLAELAAAYAGLVRDGAWHSPARAGIDAFVDRVLAPAAGEVTVHIEDGRIEGDA